MLSMRMRLSGTCFPKKLTHCAHSRFLFMCSASSGYGRRTSGHGAGSISCRRQLQRLSSILLKTTVTLILTRRSGSMHPSGLTSPCYLKRGMKTDKPVKGPVSKSEFYLEKWCPRHQKILNKTVIFQIRLISTCFDPAI
jgi:hypothetical protein